jgi:REP element-mobilizing transposase RayT
MYRNRRSIRLKGYDYSQPGAYFITICTFNRLHLFGEVTGDQTERNAYGQIAYEEWFKAAALRKNVLLYENEFVIMPNHVHGILWLLPHPSDLEPASRHEQEDETEQQIDASANPQKGERFGAPRVGSIPTVLRAYKSATTKRINESDNPFNQSIWQRNYYESIIRDEASLERVRYYIKNNPRKWYEKTRCQSQSNPMKSRARKWG